MTTASAREHTTAASATASRGGVSSSTMPKDSASASKLRPKACERSRPVGASSRRPADMTAMGSKEGIEARWTQRSIVAPKSTKSVSPRRPSLRRRWVRPRARRSASTTITWRSSLPMVSPSNRDNEVLPSPGVALVTAIDIASASPMT